MLRLMNHKAMCKTQITNRSNYSKFSKCKSMKICFMTDFALDIIIDIRAKKPGVKKKLISSEDYLFLIVLPSGVDFLVFHSD